MQHKGAAAGAQLSQLIECGCASVIPKYLLSTQSKIGTIKLKIVFLWRIRGTKRAS